MNKMTIRKMYAFVLPVAFVVMLTGCSENQLMDPENKSKKSDNEPMVSENQQMDPYLSRLLSSPNDFALANGIYLRVSQKVDSESPDKPLSLSRQETVVFEVWNSEGIIGNGGFQYLFEHDIDNFERIAESYEIIGVPSVAQAIRSALAVFPDSKPIDDFHERMGFLRTPDKQQRLDDLSNTVFDADRRTKRQLGKYIRKNRQAFVDLQPNQWEDLNELKKKDLEPPRFDASKEEVIAWLRSIDARPEDWSSLSDYPHIKDRFTPPNSGNPILSVRLSEYRNSTDDELELLSQYAALHELQKIDLSNTYVSQSGIEYLTDFPNLEILDLTRTDVQDTWLTILLRMPKLKELDVPGTAISNEGLSHISTLSSLERMTIANTPITDEGLLFLRPLQKLKTLNLAHTPVGGPGLSGMLKHFKELEELYLSNTAVGDADLQAIGELPNLTHLYLSSTKITDRGLPYLAGLKKLENLGLEITAINGSGFAQWKSMERLENLQLFESNVDDEGVARLETLASLKKLSLSGTQVTDGCFEVLSRMTQLETLSLDDTAIQGGPELRKLERLQSLEFLYLPEHLQRNENTHYLHTKLPEGTLSF